MTGFFLLSVEWASSDLRVSVKWLGNQSTSPKGHSTLTQLTLNTRWDCWCICKGVFLQSVGYIWTWFSQNIRLYKKKSWKWGVSKLVKTQFFFLAFAPPFADLNFQPTYTKANIAGIFIAIIVKYSSLTRTFNNQILTLRLTLSYKNHLPAFNFSSTSNNLKIDDLVGKWHSVKKHNIKL